MENTKEINIKNLTYYFFDDMINIESFNPDLLKLDTKSDFVKINSVSPLYIIINEVDGSIEEKNENKYLTFASASKNKKILEKYTEL